ncbi:dynamin family protein [Synechococcales cyanobacterium C]|uniref:Dynamin family protein n=1 Tax=Petrachloros mirabilis ULC683 TaxID=2781853 RepID=A0A8K2AC27_9CYAN|nr:dynamin family protein [Petrachloros mirabilis]NCJ05601.1 dynamin family protein [Petrachloros mirabilis ULC683]
MTAFPDPSSFDLQPPVHQLLELSRQDPMLRSQDTAAIQNSLRKALSPTFEIVFAGAFSAGKSMLINALLKRKLLYSAEGHATGTECQIAYAEPDQERVVLTFLSQTEIHDQATLLSQRLGLNAPMQLDQLDGLGALRQACQAIIQAEGGENRSERAKQASALNFLLEGYENNRDRIQPQDNATYPMEQFHFSTLQEAASYARRGANSAVLKRIEYACHDDLLRDGNILVDTPGIDAPVQKDAALTYDKIKDPDTSAVICVFKPAETGELTTEETELLETIRANPAIRDRVFYVFNRVDKTWYNTQLRQRLDRLIQDQFRDTTRLYKTSGLLGFYGSEIKSTSRSDRFGLDSIFAEDVHNHGSQEEAPLFVTEFNNYCASGKLIDSLFRPEIRGYERPNENYVRILSEYGTPLMDRLIQDSGVDEFRTAITRYLTEEKRPLLFANLADDLQPLCINLRKHLIETWQHLDSQPRDIEAIQEQELRLLNQELKDIGDQLCTHVEHTLNCVIASNNNRAFEEDFRKLQSRMVSRLDELLQGFSVAAVHQQAQASHKRNSVVPLLGILAEAFYHLANGLEEVLAAAAQEVVNNFFQQLLDQVKQQDYYRELYRLLGHDSGIEQRLLQLQDWVCRAIRNEAQTECDRYVRERPEFYAEGSVTIWQLRQTLQQACRGYDYQSMIEAEPAIRQLLKLDFEQKVKETVMRTFRQTINQTLNDHLLKETDALALGVLQQYDQARTYLAKTLAKEAEQKIRANQQQQTAVQRQIEAYNQATTSFNACLEAMQLDRKRLPGIQPTDLELLPTPTVPSKDQPLETVEGELIEGHLPQPSVEASLDWAFVANSAG